MGRPTQRRGDPASARAVDATTDVRTVLRRLETIGDRSRLDGMARYGIATDRALGVPIPALRRLAREIGRDHDLAAALWDSGVHEARILAAMVDAPGQVTRAQMESWVLDFDSWDLCDQVCANLFDRTRSAFAAAIRWSAREEEFVKRAGFALMACLAVHRKDVPDERFEEFLPVIRAGASDERNYVKKAVSWALRQIGKRSPTLHERATQTASALLANGSRSARWIARDALRELESPAVRARLAAARMG